MEVPTPLIATPQQRESHVISASTRISATLPLASGFLFQRKHLQNVSPLAIRRKRPTASILLQMMMLAILCVAFIPAHLAAQGSRSGSAAGAAIATDWLAAALGISALLLVAVASLLHRRRNRSDAPIPLIIDLEALSASARVSDSKLSVGTVRPEDPSHLEMPLPVASAGESPGSSSSGPLAGSLGLATSAGKGAALLALDCTTERPEPLAVRPAPDLRGEDAIRNGEERLRSGGAGRAQSLAPLSDVPLDMGSQDLGTEEPLQLLPGALEILEGAEHPTPIRFFRTAALEVPEVTLGRSNGPAYRHIHLWAPSVSRRHARMRFDAGRWTILNLSQTNPLRVNGVILDTQQAGYILSDGDHVQLGEVMLRYREHRA